MPEHRRKENDERKKKAKLWKGRFKRKTENTNTQKKWGEPQNSPINVATTTDACTNSPLLPDLQRQNKRFYSYIKQQK